MIGVYKIESPKKRIYIGQSINIEQRFSTYKNINQSSGQIKLHRSFLKYGIDNHTFEIIEECEESKLNERERYWQDYYNVLEGGLNCTLTKANDKSGKHSNETCRNISRALTGKKLSESHRRSISLCQIGKKLSKEHIEKISKANKGKPISDEHKKILSDLRKSELNCNVGKKGKDNKGSRKVTCSETGKTWDSITDCANDLNIRMKNLSRYLNGSRPNKTTIRYYE